MPILEQKNGPDDFLLAFLQHNTARTRLCLFKVSARSLRSKRYAVEGIGRLSYYECAFNRKGN